MLLQTLTLTLGPSLTLPPNSSTSLFPSLGKRVNRIRWDWRKCSRVIVFASNDSDSNSTRKTKRKPFYSDCVYCVAAWETESRKVVEHISLFKAKEGISDEEENNMLDYLYTSQYQMGGIVAISLGRISNPNDEGYTHAVYMRFQKREDVSRFYKNPFYQGVLKEHVMRYCHDCINVDYESEVDDDMLPIFRKGEEFSHGEEFILLIAFVDNAIGALAEDAMASLERMAEEFRSLIVQFTLGLNFHSSKQYSHGVVIRFRSLEAFEIFLGSSQYRNMWRSKFQPITQKTTSIHFSVDPVGTEIM